MEQTRKSDTRHLLTNAGRESSFDVTCVIGTVRLDDAGEHNPHEAAFLLIARHDTPGTFTFPTPGGMIMRVTVEHEDPS